MNSTLNNEESLVILDHESAEMTQLQEQLTEAPQEDIATEFDSFQDPAYKWDTSQQWKGQWGHSFQDPSWQYTRQ